MDTPENFFATCPRGLEEVLAAELRGLGATAVEPTPGGVGFAGPFPLCYRINLQSRIAGRVLWRIATAPYRSEDDIYRVAGDVPWSSLFTVTQTFAVATVGRHCPLRSLHFVALRIKDAVCDHFRAVCQARPSVDTKAPEVRIHAFLDEARLSLYLDTSGEALFKRGWRKSKGEAPLRENLAAGILHLAGWQPGVPLFDPMCGSGTFLIEAALIALDIAPGLGRRFAFERLRNFDAASWQRMQEEARTAAKAPERLPIWGADRDAAAVRHAQANLVEAGLAGSVEVKQEDVLDCHPPAASGLLVTNPPYGERMGEAQALAAFYPRLASVLKQRFAGWTAWFFTADRRMPQLMRLTPSRRIPLYNGPLECRLYEIRLVAGSNRRRATP